MRLTWMRGLLLAGVAVLGTGASVEGVKEARQWKFEGDIARTHGQWEAAYLAYARIAEAFPDTRHGRAAAKRARAIEAKMSSPARSPADENPASWLGEFFDFLLWP